MSRPTYPAHPHHFSVRYRESPCSSPITRPGAHVGTHSERLGTEVAPTRWVFWRLWCCRYQSQTPRRRIPNVSRGEVSFVAPFYQSLIVGWSTNRCLGILDRPVRSAIGLPIVQESSWSHLLPSRLRPGTPRRWSLARAGKLLG